MRWRLLPARVVGLVAAGLGLAACTTVPSVPPPSATVPPSFQTVLREAGATVPLAHWWTALGDPVLNALVEQAQRDNLDVAVALQRLQQAHVYELVVSGSQAPQVGADLGGGRGSGSDATRGRVANALRDGENATGLRQIAYAGGFDVSWTLDLAGAFEAQRALAAADRQAAEALRQAVLVAVTANVVQAYQDLRGLQWQAAVAARGEDAARQVLDLVSARYARGLINQLDVALAERQLASLQAISARLPGQQAAARSILALLLGKSPDALPKALQTIGPPPGLPGGVQTGLPVDLLARRPDVRAAEQAVQSAAARARLAVAHLMPSISLNGGVGLEGQDLLQGGDRRRHLWSLGAGAYWPVLDFGVLDGLSEIADAELAAQVAHYRQVVLRAVSEVDIAACAYQSEQQRLAALAKALAAATRSVELAQARYDRGLTDFLNVADAQRQAYDLEAQYVQSQTAALDQFVALYRALGGGWEDAPPPPPIRPPEPAVLAAFHHLFPRGGENHDAR